MTVTQADAAAALRDVDAANTHSRQLYGYSKASPHLLLWGALWIAAGVLLELFPTAINWVWLGIDVVGFSASLYVAFAQSRTLSNTSGRQTNWAMRYMALIAIALAFFFAVLTIFGPINAAQAMSLSALLLSAVYMGIGLWIGTRYLVIGAILGALTLTGYVLLPDYALTFISCAGGAALMIGGFWMRRA